MGQPHPIPSRKELVEPRHQAAQLRSGDKGPFVPPSPGDREELGPGGRRPLAPGGGGEEGPASGGLDPGRPGDCELGRGAEGADTRASW